ncbi:phosphoglycerate mutase [Tahibacter soli]|uniref:Phosphoglycerate mutase n=1 Tax=Tahibacter soli TaxID=2983605 RepID=A0A9X4BIW2_9GAMM|nr:phosphoglycerate mutase [Tahibacter soli]MDC8014426.1 phosphoglycerate mutase [Tahibacter soli]
MTSTLLLPPLKRIAADTAVAGGPLARWCARGDRLPDAAPGRQVEIREHFQFAGTEAPVAALTRQADAGDAANAVWLRADPAYVRADMATARLMACGEMGLSADDCAALIRPLKPLFGDAGFPIDAPTPARWYLRGPPGAQLPTFSAPADALGDDLRRHLPQGALASRWTSLLNEAQMILHEHPLNRERAARGLPPVNSLWFWGAGSQPAFVKTTLAVALTRDPVLAALAQRAGIAAIAPDVSRIDSAQAQLFDLDDAAGLAELASRWLPAFDAALSKKRIAALCVAFASGERYIVKPGHRWRFWRRVRPLAA